MKQIIKQIKRAKDVIIIMHVNPDGDACGSAFALAEALENMGKKVSVLCEDEVPKNYRFLSEGAGRPGGRPLRIQGQTVIVLDTPSKDRMGTAKEYLKDAECVINIDHHTSNENYADINYVRDNASSVGEILYDVLKKMKVNITKSIAQALYVSILTDTGGFLYSNTTSYTLKVASELMEYGIDVNEIFNRIYNTKSVGGYRLLGLALATLTVERAGRPGGRPLRENIGYMKVTQKMFEETATTPADTDDFVDYIRSIDEVSVAMIFKEYEEGVVKISFRSKNDFDVNKFANKFGGGGHKRASGCTVTGDIDAVVGEVLESLKTFQV